MPGFNHINIAMAGIQNGLNGMQENASQIASKAALEGGSTQSLVESLVDLKANVQQVNASAKFLAATDEVIGSLLDIRA